MKRAAGERTFPCVSGVWINRLIYLLKGGIANEMPDDIQQEPTDRMLQGEVRVVAR